MMSGTLKQKKGYPVYIILSKLHTGIPENILGHSQTVCDTSSSFSGISKIKTRWKLRNCYSHYVKDLRFFACMANTLKQKMYILI